MNPRPFVAALGAAALVGVGCSGDPLVENLAERALEQALDGDVDINFDEDGGDITVDTTDGTFEQSFGEGASLPDDFPAEIPVPDGFTPFFSQSSSDDDGQGWSVSFLGDPGVSDAGADIQAAFESAGFVTEHESTTNAGGNETVSLVMTNDSWSVIISIGSSDGETSVSYFVSEVEADS